jgi:DNA (cytosine-5)-methyltransferase 1
MKPLRVLDLFSGIGGFSLGLERTGGFETVAFCEIEPFPRKVLAKHWPEVPCYEDVTKLTAEQLAADGIAVDVICGGFPCQDISFAGKGAGLAGARSGLFYEVARLVGELGPRYVILENVGALLSRGLDAVLGTLASVGYDAEWHCIPASYVGAPHRRDRVWLLAYPAFVQRHVSAHNAAKRLGRPFPKLGNGGRQEALANADSEGLEGRAQSRNFGKGGPWVQQFIERCADRNGPIWRTEPDVGRVANGVPDRAHRLKALGNAVVPQIPELIGNAILASIKTEGA